MKGILQLETALGKDGSQSLVRAEAIVLICANLYSQDSSECDPRREQAHELIIGWHSLVFSERSWTALRSDTRLLNR